MSATFSLIEGALTTFRAMPGYGSPDQNGVVPVFDGAGEVGESPEVWIVIGARTPWAEPDVDDLAGSSDSEVVSLPLSAGSRREAVTIPCAVGAYSGSINFRSLRESIDGCLADMDEQLRSTDALGMSNVVSLTMSVSTFRQAATADGAEAVMEFDLSASFIVGGGAFTATYEEDF